jgi:hypothetical protein
MGSMNISRSWDKKCIEKANNLYIMDIINSPYFNFTVSNWFPKLVMVLSNQFEN